ncbi:MAG: helix-turn-helix domain-containing protein [Oscillospiraceae bacterium]
MENINSVVAENLKLVREQRKLSLDAVAKLTGVSKSMLGQIERGEVSPTISTVWKIANGLKLSFTELVSRPKTDYEIVELKQLCPLIEDDERYRAYPVFPYDNSRRFEMYAIEIEAGGGLKSEPHPLGTEEFITVFSGELTVYVENEAISVQTGNSFRFRADRHHRYQNRGRETCRLSMVIHYHEQ